MSFIDLEETYNRVNREALWQFLRMCDVDGKLLSGIKSMYVTSLACVRMKWGESECFRIESGVRTRLFLLPLSLKRVYGWSDERGEIGDGEDGSMVSERGKRMEIA